MTSETSPTPEHTPASLPEMIASIAKTFAIAHDKDSDEHLAQALVFNAGRMAWRMRENGISVDQKTSISDVVTDADRAAEQFISTVLELIRPEDGVLGEEGAQRPSTSGKTWVIDPVDGTYNFASGSDYWCSALALVEGDPENPTKLLFGAVHRATMGDTWFGGPGIATSLNGKRVMPLADEKPANLCLATYLHPSFLNDAPVRDAWMRVASEFASLRMLGSGSIDLSSVASGTWGAWMQHSVPAWDWLPGKAIIEGAGGVARSVEAGGKTWCIAGNIQAVEQMEQFLTQE